MQLQVAVPDVMTYNALISICEKCQRAELALQSFEIMQWQTVVLDESS